MKRALIPVIGLIVTLSVWPSGRAHASIDRAREATGVMIMNTSANPGELLQLAKHDDHDEAEEEGEHRHHHRHGRHHKAEEEINKHPQYCGPYFKPGSIPYFRNYYTRDNYANLPPGLRKHVAGTGHLPPGLEKKYERIGQLPPGLQKRIECGQTLPADYSPYLYPVPPVAYERVGPLPPDSRLYLYGNDLILLNDHTKAIIDILRGAYRYPE